VVEFGGNLFWHRRDESRRLDLVVWEMLVLGQEREGRDLQWKGFGDKKIQRWTVGHADPPSDCGARWPL
jgi:hypothetical protein